MKKLCLIWSVAVLMVMNGFAQAPPDSSNQTSTNRARGPGRDPKMDSFYKLGPDSMAQEGVPKGRFDGPKVIPSEVFPGTQHTYWVYLPAQYDPVKPAALIIFNRLVN